MRRTSRGGTSPASSHGSRTPGSAGTVPPQTGFPTCWGYLSLAGLYAISQYNFLLFHCLAEAFSIVIAIAVFAIFWNTRRLLDNGVYLVIGFGCLFAALLDLI